VRDDEVGIHDEVIRHTRPARDFSPQGMREGAEAVGGRLEVRSKAGEGTVVDLSILAAGAYAASPRRSAMSRLQASTRA
jgi:signal transduction histidine kinase